MFHARPNCLRETGRPDSDANAKAFGYPTYWVNRLSLPVEELGLTPDGTGPDLGGVEAFCRPT